jgi:hypothetical protein
MVNLRAGLSVTRMCPAQGSTTIQTKGCRRPGRFLRRSTQGPIAHVSVQNGAIPALQRARHIEIERNLHLPCSIFVPELCLFRRRMVPKLSRRSGKRADSDGLNAAKNRFDLSSPISRFYWRGWSRLARDRQNSMARWSFRPQKSLRHAFALLLPRP